jgi:hypothetical protein
VVTGAMWFIGRDEKEALERVRSGRRDAKQLRVVYVLPVDARVGDEADATLRRYTEVVVGWFARQTGGRRMRVVRDDDGEIAIQRLFVSRPRTELAQEKAYTYVREQVFANADVAGDDLPLVFVASDTEESVCGQAFDAAIVWLGNGFCQSGPGLTSNELPPAVAAHEIIHGLGGVADCAPHQGGGHHVTDDPRDIMYVGNNVQPVTLDPGRDDYYGHDNDGCRDIADANIWEN